MIARHDAFRRLLAAGLLVTLAACTTAKLETPEAPGVNPNEVGNTNDPAAGFANAGPGSEEDFILNVGRRTFFTSGSAELDSVARATLDKQAAFMQQNPRWLMKLQGFADDPGSESAQLALSQKRADAAMRYLVSKGVDPKRMWAKGYGKERLVRACTENSCRVQNRRVVSNLRNEYDTP
ncbi:OmpA family protein [Mesorhizobium sp. ASY16-5R]|jgi:peptidoglycan-associated lipoprotein|uniref:OmpA family protein n=1 Tax=Mesorhizobium sp. ASY16-5R TaxID=3445772 RepID=UPI003FA17E1C